MMSTGESHLTEDCSGEVLVPAGAFSFAADGDVLAG